MDIKCNFNPYYNKVYECPLKKEGIAFYGAQSIARECVQIRADVFVKRPVDAVRATGLLGIKDKKNPIQRLFNNIKNYAKNYVKNVKHTYDHKLIYALVEKELYGKNSLDSLTHDADKMVMYLLGFPKSFVTNFHRKHSSHHVESGKRMNLRSMLCDNVASSPEFKPEKKLGLREYFNRNKELQGIKGLKKLMEDYNFGENLNFDKINQEKNTKFRGFRGNFLVFSKLLLFGLI